MSGHVSIGKFIRKMLGRLYRPAIECYRALFVDYKELIKQICFWVPPKDGLEILDFGCGEGLFTEMIADAYSEARIKGIDVSSSVGQMFWRKSDRVSFVCDSIQNFIAAHGPVYDLVIICDVIHHVAIDERRALLLDVKKVLKKNGRLIIKDWARTHTPVNLFAYFMDRYVSNCPTYFSADFELRQLLTDVFGCDCVEEEVSVRNCRNNIVFFVKV